MNAMKDSRLSFGTITLAGSDAAFSNVLEFPDAGNCERMQVEIRCSDAGAGGTSVIFSVQGSASSGGTYYNIVAGDSIALADLDPSVGGSPLQTLIIPKHTYKCLRVYADVTGTFTGGTFSADLDTYVGV